MSTGFTKIGKVAPTYRGVWLSAQSYERLDIVANTNKTLAYIARKDVPAGTALTNGTYWAIVLDVRDVYETVSNISSSINGRFTRPDDTTFCEYTVGTNLFNPALAVENVIFSVAQSDNGEIIERADGFAAYVRLVGAGTYTLNVADSIYGTLTSKINLYDRHKTYLETVVGTLSEDRTVLTVEISNENAFYLGYSHYAGRIGSIMVVYGSELPSEYIAYEGKYTLDGVEVNLDEVLSVIAKVNDRLENIIIGPEDTSFIDYSVGTNLFDQSGTIDHLIFSVVDGDDGALVERPSGDTKAVFSQYVRLDGPGTYTFDVAATIYGTYKNRINIYDRHKRYLATLTGTLNDAGTINTVLIDAADAVFIGYTHLINQKDNVMVVKGSEYPAEYAAFDGKYTLRGVTADGYTQNALYGKTVAFDGDSICNGSSAKDGRSGWAGRIGSANNMSWKNYGISGGTVAVETYYANGNPRHWISRNIDIIHAEMPDLDYLILEGGTNDADVLNESTQLGSFDLGDFGGTYDDTTFCGALETLFYKAVTYYPKAKIGYIVAHRMGASASTANYDTGSKRYRYFLKAMEICKKWSIPYINLWDTAHMIPKLQSMYNSTLTAGENINGGYLYTDGQHLTPAGYAVITPMIEAWMRTM